MFSPPESNELAGNGSNVYGELVADQNLFDDQQTEFLNYIRLIFAQGLRYRLPCFDPNESLFQGGHVVIEDQGLHYMQWYIMAANTSQHFVDRSNNQSHETVSPAFEMKLPDGWGCVLIGNRHTRGSMSTWFQVEGHSMEGMLNKLAHASDYVKHKYNNDDNVGPKGTSSFSEKKNNELTISQLIFRRFIKGHANYKLNIYAS